MDVMRERAGCVARKLARRRPAEFREIPGPGGLVFRAQLDKPEFTGPRSLGDWLDDRLITTPARGDAGAVLYAVAAAARSGGAEAAVAAAGAARRLGAWDQFWLWRTLAAWGAEAHLHAAAPAVMRAITREWERLGLVTEVPDNVPVPVATVNAAELKAADSRRRQRAVIRWPRPACLDLAGWL